MPTYKENLLKSLESSSTGRIKKRDDARKSFLLKLDKLAGDARSKWVTDHPFLGEEYKLAEKQAVACMADPDPDPDNYLTLKADVTVGTFSPLVGRPVQTVTEAAELILLKSSLYEQALISIRTIRFEAKAAISAAVLRSDMESILANIEWPLPPA